MTATEDAITALTLTAHTQDGRVFVNVARVPKHREVSPVLDDLVDEFTAAMEDRGLM